MEKLQQIQFPTHADERGPLTVIELQDYIDWDVKRIYYVTDVKLPRGGHAVKHERKIYVCQKGSCLARFHDGNRWREFRLEGPNSAILMKEMCYREFVDFSDDAVLMAISSVKYNQDDYIYDFDEYLEYIKSTVN